MAPHHRVLDMYGSSQARMHLMASELDERGELVANIMGALSLESVGLRQTPDNVIMTRLGDDRLSREEMGSFDRVLLDIPALIGRHLTARQRSERLVSLLLRAIELCRDGGRVVYMTHDHLAQNNEMVIDQVINDAHKGIALRGIALADIVSSPGNTACSGQQLDPRIARTLHVNDSTGSDHRFLAVFECGHS
ncbi:hypothetical protein GCM10010082_06640 [Kushneria pakistanensis]|uniref:Uncharacterized protein n=1 Tax=Kushneria pakistanensis TaxID=1508770 RepID=A0ABQ3FCB9_9GAMM|nr:hypothetical protein [Kushneria pakistanensis]GHC18005.1 hypothetical protein GCM10010082_06640 [Kushneria pakistanensis]